MLIQVAMAFLNTTAQYDELQDDGTQQPSTSAESMHHSPLTADTTVYRVLAGLVLCVLALIALITNILLVWVIMKSTQLRTWTNAFIVSIASSDIIFAIAVILPAALFVNLSPTSPRSCMAAGSFSVLTQSATSLSLMMVSIDRCIAVTWPLKYTIAVTSASVTIMLLVVWIISLTMAVMPLMGLGHFVFVMWHCALEIPESFPYLMVQRILTVFLPGIVIAIMITVILRSAYNQRRVFAILPMPGLALAVSKRPAIVYRRSTLSAMRTLFFIVAMLTVLWAPWLLFDFSQLLQLLPRIETASITSTVTYYFTFLTCILNPFVFLFNKKYKQRLKELLSMWWVKSPAIKACDRSTSRATVSTAVASMSSLSSSSLRPPSRVLYIDTRAPTLQVPTFINVNPMKDSDDPDENSEASIPSLVTYYDVPDIIVSSISDEGEHIVEQRRSRRSVTSLHGRQSLDQTLTIHIPRISLSTI